MKSWTDAVVVVVPKVVVVHTATVHIPNVVAVVSGAKPKHEQKHKEGRQPRLQFVKSTPLYYLFI